MTTEIVISSKEKVITPCFHNLVSELEGVWKSRDKEKGEEKSRKSNLWWTSDKISTTQDNHWTSRRRANSKQAQSKSQTDEDRASKSSAMKTVEKKSVGRSH